jgi:hypothetical protein
LSFPIIEERSTIWTGVVGVIAVVMAHLLRAALPEHPF